MSLERPLRVGVVGAGGIAPLHVEGWLTLGASVGVYSQVGSKALADKYGIDVCDSFDELASGADVIDICTPTAGHPEYVERGLAAGLHVVCEKPLARTAFEARRLLELSRGAAGRLFVAHVVRYFPEYAQLRQAVSEGRIGEPAVLRFSRTGAAPSQEWFLDPEQSGGIILDQSVHDLDQALWLAGPARSVFATTNPAAGMPFRPPAVASITVEHTSGAISQIVGMWGAPGTTFRTSFHVAGTEGTLWHDSSLDRTVRSIDLPVVSGGGYLPPSNPADSPYTLQLKDFVESIESGGQPRVTVPDAVAAVELAEAALESVRTGQPVVLAGGQNGESS